MSGHYAGPFEPVLYGNLWQKVGGGLVNVGAVLVGRKRETGRNGAGLFLRNST